MDGQEERAEGRATRRKGAESPQTPAPSWWPALKAALAAWTVDGDMSRRPTLTIFAAGPTCFKAVLNDRLTGLQLWGTATSLGGLLAHLDETLCGEEVPWEQPTNAGPQSVLAKLLGLKGGGRAGQKLLE